MRAAPCLTCPGKDKDKNNPVCLECEKRLRYVSDIENSLPLAATAKGREDAAHRLPTYSHPLRHSTVGPDISPGS
jgi:hypothetical protein